MHTRLSLRAQLLLALVGPAAIVVGLVVWRAEAISARALEAALEERLISVAEAAGSVLSPRVTVLGPGDDQTRTKRNALARLAELRVSTRVARLLVIRFDNEAHSVILDTAEELPIGAPYRRAEFDRLELEAVKNGGRAASLLFRGPSGRPFKTGYAPLRSSRPLSAYIAAVAPATYTDALAALRQRLSLVGAVGLLILGSAAVLVAAFLSRPLARLSEAATAIGAGSLDADIPAGGPREAVVLATTMRSMTRSLQAREEEMQMMLAGIAHEVRNPLGGIELFGGLLKEDLQNDPRGTHVDKILRELGLLSRVVNDFLDFARRKPHQPKVCELADLLLPLSELVNAHARTQGVRVEIASPPPDKVWLDRESVQRALLNLARNGIQAARNKVRVQTLVEPDGTLILEVEDDGAGVPKDHREKIFAPFFTTKQKGTGLGLALVRQTARAHGGRVTVDDSGLGGARFVLRLPPKPSTSVELS